MRVSEKGFGIVINVTIGFVMSFFMSLLMLLASVGLVEGFFMMWVQSLAIGFAVALPLALVAIPLTGRILRVFLRVQE